MLHHPFVEYKDLLAFDGENYTSHQEAFEACLRLHAYTDDYYSEPKHDQEESDSSDGDNSEFSDNNGSENAMPLADFEAYAQRRLNQIEPLDGFDGFRTCHSDRAYNWPDHVGCYVLDLDGWDQLRAKNPIDQNVDVESSPESLNSEQQKFYNAVVEHYTQELSSGLQSQLLLNVDGVAGPGKTYSLLKICTRLQEMATEAGKQNPVFRAAPTGIAAY